MLSPIVQQFIRQHEQDDVAQLTLKFETVHGVPIALVADQIAGRRKAKDKLPSYYRTESIIYPPGLNLEQSSSEATASLKSTLLNKLVADKDACADLTGGLGIDSFFLSRVFRNVSYVEVNATLLEIAAHNHIQLGATNITYHQSSAEEFLRDTDQIFDCIYIDPSRRDRDRKKTVSLSACDPDVTTLFPEIFKRTGNVLIKASPLLDLDKARNDLSNVNRIFVIAIGNECRELLLWCKAETKDELSIETINIRADGSLDSFVFDPAEEKHSKPRYSDPLTYLYEPNAAILKGGAFKTVSERFKLAKLHPNTHLYTSEDLRSDFPGKAFRIMGHVKPEPKSLKMFLPTGKANITTRNYPLSVEDLRRKTRLIDGGSDFLIGFSGMQKKFLVVANRLY